jgi:hypothetical protein
LSARTYADLDQVVTDLPVAPATVVTTAAKTTAVTPVAKTNGLAIASLACGLAQFAFGPLATIPRSCAATWPAARSSAPENKERAWRWRA